MSDPAEPAITPGEIDSWRTWIGRQETRRQVLDVETLRRFAAAVGADLDVERTPPPLGHWAYLLGTVPTEALGADGHPRNDGAGLLPPIPLARRMFAGATIDIVQPLRLGEAANLTLTVSDVEHRAGRAGDLVFVRVQRELSQNGQLSLKERQTLVYRDQSAPTPSPICSEKAATSDAAMWIPQPVDLFRFSAATFNAHRIHYDRSYAEREEGYPDLVVHGPLTAAKLCGFAGARLSEGRRLLRFEFRAMAPLFVGQPVTLAAAADPGFVEAMRCDGVTAMSASALFLSAAS